MRHREGAHIEDEVLWRADGTSFPAEYWRHRIVRNNEVIGAVVTFLDITERRRAEKKFGKGYGGASSFSPCCRTSCAIRSRRSERHARARERHSWTDDVLPAKRSDRRTPGRSDGATGRRSARRLADHARADRAAHVRVDLRERAVGDRSDRAVMVEGEHAPDDRPADVQIAPKRFRPAPTDSGQPDQQRLEVLARGGHIRFELRRDGGASRDPRPRPRPAASRPSAAAHLRALRAGRSLARPIRRVGWALA